LGCDGSNGHSKYKQRSLEDVSDSDNFITSVVPLQLYSTKILRDEIIHWQNPRLSSVRHCRPIRMQFKKETAELAKEEISIVEERIKKIETTVITLEEQTSVVSVSHNAVLTMTDAKICNAVTSTTSGQVCYVCGAAPKQMNRIDEIVKTDVDTTTYKFGLSTLHARIRFFECLLHISYRLEIKKNGKQEEKKTNERYKITNKLFKTSSKMKWVFWSIKLSLAEAERQTTEIQLEGFLKIIENLLELLVSTKILFENSM
jgi:hypothetical protein